MKGRPPHPDPSPLRREKKHWCLVLKDFTSAELVFVQTEASTRSHVFVVMLAYLLERELAHYWRHLDLTVSEALDELGSVLTGFIRQDQIITF